LQFRLSDFVLSPETMKEQGTMDGCNSSRSRYPKFVATALLGLTLIALAAQPAESAPWRRARRMVRNWGGYRAYRMPYRNIAPVYPRYGTPAVAPRYYNSNYFYRGAVPYGYGSGGYSAPMAPGFGGYGIVPPML
jgi:hypothetical protein